MPISVSSPRHALGLLVALLLAISCFGLTAQAGTTNVATGVYSDLAINGSGYFVVRDPVTGLPNATRYGNFTIDSNGYLVTQAGSRVQGFDDVSLSTIGDVQLSPPDGEPVEKIIFFEILTDGDVEVFYDDGTSAIVGQILLQNFLNPSALTQIANRTFTWSDSAGPLSALAAPGTSGTGLLLTGTLELLVPELQLSIYSGPSTNFSQGILVPTGVPTDLGIEGNGFFVLRRTNDNALFATRVGAFYLDASGYLTHYSGLRLQGYSNASLNTIGDVQVNANVGGNPSVFVDNYGIDNSGNIQVGLTDGSTFISGQILLRSCSNPNLAARTNFDLYPIVASNGLWSAFGQPLTGNFGRIVPGSVELSQFDTNLLIARSNVNFFLQGKLVSAPSVDDVAIEGGGFFTVRDPAQNVLYAARVGGFHLDGSNYLVTSNGFRVQGMDDKNLTQYGDIVIDSAGASAQVVSHTINYSGVIAVTLSGGSTFTRGQILLQTYQYLQGLKPAGNGLYSNVVAALPKFTSGLSGYIQNGEIISGALELPNPPPALQLPPASGFRLFVTDLDAFANVQESDDVIHWNTIGQVGPSDLNAAEFFDTPQSPHRVYRVGLHN